MLNFHKSTVAERIHSFVFLLGFVLLTSCASNSDVENLQSQIDDLKASLAQSSSNAASALEAQYNAQKEVEMLRERMKQFESLCSPSQPSKKM